MDFEAVRKLVEAGDAAGLAKILLFPRFESAGDVRVSGEGARKILGDLPYKSVHIVDLNSVQRLDVNADERKAAAAALGRIATKEAVGALIEGLKDSSLEVSQVILTELKAASLKLKGAELPWSAYDELESQMKWYKKTLTGLKLLDVQANLQRFFDL